MTPKPRSTYTDHTRKLRTGRRNAILNAAAARMGFASWTHFSTEIRKAADSAETETQLVIRLLHVLENSIECVRSSPVGPVYPPDIQAVLAAYPPRKAGRPKTKSSPD